MEPCVCRTEEGYFRTVGFALFYIGSLYVLAGLSDNKHFALCTVMTRLVFTTIGMLHLGLGGWVKWTLAALVFVLDIALGLLTLVLWIREDKIAASQVQVLTSSVRASGHTQTPEKPAVKS